MATGGIASGILLVICHIGCASPKDNIVKQGLTHIDLQADKQPGCMLMVLTVLLMHVSLPHGIVQDQNALVLVLLDCAIRQVVLGYET